LELLIYEASEKIKVTMPSKKFKIDISNELLKKLEDEQIMYKLN
jgi:DNA polymerase-3 subunit alpha